jgi:hypothetical protein
MPKSTVIVLILVILVSVVASSSLGYLVGSGQSQSFQSAVVALNQTKTVTVTVVNSSSFPTLSGSFPVQPNPYEFSAYFQGRSAMWYIPVVFVGKGSTAEMYVNYNCAGSCGSANSSIAIRGITETLPHGFSISETGKVSPSTDISFGAASIVELEKNSETVLYTLTISPSSSGYYTFSIPFGCFPEPVLYVKTAAADYGSLIDWLRSLNTAQVGCSDIYNVTILGFTNSFYTEIPLMVNSSS